MARIHNACIFFLFFSLLIKETAFTQDLPVKNIPEVTVIQRNSEFFSEDQTTQTVNGDYLQLNRHQNLGYLLVNHSPVLIRSYGGTGSLTSVSLHGTGSNHTQISWNGFPLNSPTTGQVDLSLIPAGFLQSLEVINGASGALFGSGTFGGSISLTNEPDWNNRIAVNYSLNTGSFGSSGHLLLLRTGNSNIQYQLSAITTRSENDFTYRDSYKSQSPAVKNLHNSFHSTGLMQNLFLNMKNGNHLEAGLWLQKKMIEIPALMGSYMKSNARQKDSVFRSFISYHRITPKAALNIKSAYFSDFIRFTDKNQASDTVNSIDSRIATQRWMHELSYRYYWSARVAINGGATYNRISGVSGNYGGKVVENDYALFGNLKLNLTNVIINAALRKEFYDGLNPPVQYSIGFRYSQNNHFILRSGFSSKFRKPTFNEKHWQPGGNPMLRPEKGRGGDITAEWSSRGNQKKPVWIDGRITAYYQWIDNWIQWVISDSLTPVEYKKVHVRGIDTWLRFGYDAGNVAINGLFDYSFNRSVIIRTYDNNQLFEGNQLMYVPLHAIHSGMESRYRGMILGLYATYNSQRETVETADHTLRLAGYWVCNISAGYKKRLRNIDFMLSFHVDNVFDKAYEVIRSYPVPGRNYCFSVSIGFQKSNNEY